MTLFVCTVFLRILCRIVIPGSCHTFGCVYKEAFGTKLKLSTTFHVATDGQTERTIQTLNDMLRACALEFQKSWVKSLNLVEFSYNNSYHASIQMALYEALYGRKCRSPTCWSDISDALVLDLEMIQETIAKV